MNRLTKWIPAIGMLLAVPAVLACEYPQQVEIPNGESATREQMIESQRAVKDYVATMEEYLDCLIEEEQAARAEMEELSAEDEQLREDMLNKKYNAAVDEMERVAAQFNAEVQAYKDRSDE